MLRSAHDHRGSMASKKALPCQKSRGQSLVRHAPHQFLPEGPFRRTPGCATRNHVILVRASKYVEHLLEFHGPSTRGTARFFGAMRVRYAELYLFGAELYWLDAGSPSRVLASSSRMADRRIAMFVQDPRRRKRHFLRAATNQQRCSVRCACGEPFAFPRIASTRRSLIVSGKSTDVGHFFTATVLASILFADVSTGSGPRRNRCDGSVFSKTPRSRCSVSM